MAERKGGRYVEGGWGSKRRAVPGSCSLLFAFTYYYHLINIHPFETERCVVRVSVWLLARLHGKVALIGMID